MADTDSRLRNVVFLIKLRRWIMSRKFAFLTGNLLLCILTFMQTVLFEELLQKLLFCADFFESSSLAPFRTHKKQRKFEEVSMQTTFRISLKNLKTIRYTSVSVVWVVMPCGLVGRYQRFGGTCCLRPEDGGSLCSSETLVSTYK
jgi:hypothetical protein